MWKFRWNLKRWSTPHIFLVFVFLGHFEDSIEPKAFTYKALMRMGQWCVCVFAVSSRSETGRFSFSERNLNMCMVFHTPHFTKYKAFRLLYGSCFLFLFPPQKQKQLDVKMCQEGFSHHRSRNFDHIKWNRLWSWRISSRQRVKEKITQMLFSWCYYREQRGYPW